MGERGRGEVVPETPPPSQIVLGFVAKLACSWPGLCRELFFGESIPAPGTSAEADATLARWMGHFKADSRVGLDLVDLTRNELPSLRADPESGQAEWRGAGGTDVEVYVMGAKQDYLVDEEGVAETARFFGVEYEMVDVAHDVMLGETWEVGAAKVAGWLEGLGG